MNNNMSVIAEALVYNYTIFNNKESLINGGQVGVETYGKWKSTMTNAWDVFYKYECAKRDLMLKKVTTVKVEREAAMTIFKEILDLIGEVNGFKLESSVDNLNALSQHSKHMKKSIKGKAMTLASEVSNLDKQLKNVHTGMNEDYVSNLEKQYEAKVEELKLAKKQVESADRKPTQVKFNKFLGEFEHDIASIIQQQSAQPYEEIVAEREAKKAANRAKAKARRDANKAAKTSNQPVETVAA